MARGAPKGNKFGIGNSGGGRPSHKDTVWHLEKWEKDSLVDVLRKKIANDCYSIRDRWLLMALEGSVVMTKQAADKVLADLHDLRGKDGERLIPLEEAIASLSTLRNK